MRADVIAALEAHFDAGRPRGRRLFRDELDRRGLYESNLTQVAFDRQAELVERWRENARELGTPTDGAEFDEDTRAMLWIDGVLAALALVDAGVLP
jgi:hypothetical protein